VAYRYDSVKTDATMTCTRPVIGRLYTSRGPEAQKYSQVLCVKVVLIGHQIFGVTQTRTSVMEILSVSQEVDYY